MRRRLRFMLLAVIGVILSVGIGACGSSDSSSSGSSGSSGNGSFQLSIGQLVPLTGSLADFGPSMAASGNLAVKQINDAIKKDGLDQSVTIKTADTQGEPAAAVQAARQLAAEGAQCFAGPASTEEALPVARAVAIREEIPMVASVATAQELVELNDEGYVSRIMIGDAYQGQALVDGIGKYTFHGSVKGKTISIASRNDAYGTAVDKNFVEAWERAGGKVDANVLFDPEQDNYDSEAAQVAESEPDVYLYIGFPKEFLRFAPALARTGKWKPENTWSISLESETLPQEAGPALTEGLGSAGQGAVTSSGAYKAFRHLYNESGGPPGQAFDPHEFDAVMTCYLAAAAAGSTEPKAMAEEVWKVTAPPGEKFTWQQLPEALKALKEGKEINYEGVSGPIDLNQHGDPTKGAFIIYKIEHGEFVQIGQVLVNGSNLTE